MDDEPGETRRMRHGSHDLAYVLGEGASIGRSRVLQDAGAVAPLVLLNALLSVAIYIAFLTRGATPHWDAFVIVGPTLALLPVIIAFVLVSLRDHEQPITVAVFVSGVAVAIAIAIISALRIFMSYAGVLGATVPTVFVMIVVMLRLKQAETERVALLDFPGAAAALQKLGGGIPVISGSEAELGSFDRFLIDVATHYSDRWSRFLLRSYMRGVLVTPWVQFLEKRRGKVDIDAFELSDIVLRPSQILYSRLKRFMDILGVIVALPFALVIGGATALYILVKAGRPVLFTQQRRGFGGRNFTIHKFRTMRLDAASRPASDSDSRIVPGLKIVRKLRLDELPQLYDILRGEMSWVGPRPSVISFADGYEAAEPKYASRLLVRPGLSGWAQVNSGYASNHDDEMEKLGYDLYYVKNMSFDLDLLILGKTVRILLFGVGAK